MSKTKAVFGIVSNQALAIRTVDALKVAGFSADDISALFPDKSGTKDFAHEQDTKAPEGAAVGAGVGGALGGGLGWLVGIGALAIPGVGPFFAARPIMAALSGAAAGALVGGLTGTLIGLCIPEYEAKRYEGKIKDGNILLSVHASTDHEIDRAKAILQNAGVEDISQQIERRNDDSKPENQGEGDRESARRFNESEQDFVNSPRGRLAIKDAGNVDQNELAELRDAEQEGLARAKEEDPAVLRRAPDAASQTNPKSGKQ